MDTNNVIDARFIFTAKRDVIHSQLVLGLLERACPMGGTVVPFPVCHVAIAAGSDTQDDWSWLDELCGRDE
jgi:hypothetical protein